jgi:hypothetical protein
LEAATSEAAAVEATASTSAMPAASTTTVALSLRGTRANRDRQGDNRGQSNLFQ